MEQQPLILDPCCGSRMMWFDRGHKDVVFGDKRRETLTVTDRSHKEDGTRTLVVEPDALMDFRALPYQRLAARARGTGSAVDRGRLAAAAQAQTAGTRGITLSRRR